jgi:uncharacterized protein
MQWLNEPPAWRADPANRSIHVHAGAHTDFWRKTEDGGVRHSGHFYFQPVTGNFVARVRVVGAYGALYDQAGLMVRRDESTWIKCGIELLHGVQQASTVVTRDWSDWSVTPLPNPPALRLQIVRHGGTFEVSYALDGQDFTLMRQTYLSDAGTLSVGPMVAAPTGDGFDAVFEDFTIEPR